MTSIGFSLRERRAGIKAASTAATTAMPQDNRMNL